MLCDNCKDKVVMDAFTVTKCKVCGIKIVTPHMPGYKVCPSCAKTQGLCEQCGDFEGQTNLFTKL